MSNPSNCHPGSTEDAYPPCFYLPQSCSIPCTREEYQRCPLNPEIGLKAAVEASTEKPLDPIIEEAITKAKQMREKMRIMGDQHLREITENLRRAHAAGSGLVCPSCGDGDHGNRMGKKPWCMKCNLPLMKSEKAAKWIKPQQPKKFTRGYEEPDGMVRSKRK